MHSNPADEQTKINLCIGGIRDICTYQATGQSCPTTSDGKTVLACATDAHTQNRACQVQEGVNAIKQSIAATEVIQEEIKKLADEENGQGSLGNAVTGKKVSMYRGVKMDDRQSVDVMTTLTSGQLEKAIEVEEDKTIFDEAAEKLNTDCQGTLTEECKKYVLDGEEIQEAKDKISELALRMSAMEERVKKI